MNWEDFDCFVAGIATGLIIMIIICVILGMGA